MSLALTPDTLPELTAMPLRAVPTVGMDPLRPARGLVNGLLLAALFWSCAAVGGFVYFTQ